MTRKEAISETNNKAILIYDIPTRARTYAGRIRAMRKRTDLDDETIKDFLQSAECDICVDGILVWAL